MINYERKRLKSITFKSKNHVLNLHQHFITLIYNSKLLTCKPVAKFQRYQHNLEDVESGHVSGQFKTS